MCNANKIHMKTNIAQQPRRWVSFRTDTHSICDGTLGTSKFVFKVIKRSDQQKDKEFRSTLLRIRQHRFRFRWIISRPINTFEFLRNGSNSLGINFLFLLDYSNFFGLRIVRCVCESMRLGTWNDLWAATVGTRNEFDINDVAVDTKWERDTMTGWRTMSN